MRPRTDPAVLWARAVLLASVAVFLGAAGHVTADGLLPGPAALVVLYVVAVVGAAAFLARPASPLRLVALLVGGQTVVHLVLSAAAGHVGDPARPAAGPAPAPAGTLPTVDGRRVGTLQDAFDVGAGHASGPALPVGHLLDHLTGQAPMMLAHLVVAVAVGLWLAVGERSLWTLLALAATVVLAPLQLLAAIARAGLPVVRRLAVRAAAPLRPPHSLVLARAVVRRGPPLVAR
ncbi:MAG TPA: hypothetical protein VMF51_24825 [Nocardioides sp.]|uniref:hypothetical protein n=1 Tax=Nocardioides sp. TaxID=35761 RepID=UPI002B9A2318|nr:hypothetical protein [Nocardioides sp.]HTW18372.1 hypothetical protein [Nocardioides sp.]